MRRKRKFTQQKLDDKCGIDRASISQYELETRQPTFETIEKIANACGYEVIFRDINTKEELTKENIDREEI